MATPEILEQFNKICTRLSAGIPGSFRWQWDTRFNVALVVIDKNSMAAILALISQEFKQNWNNANIDSAPEAIMDVVNNVFGIQPGQILFNSDDQNDLILLAAWWPWGNGASISLRIGLFQPKEQAISPADMEKLLREWFSL